MLKNNLLFLKKSLGKDRYYFQRVAIILLGLSLVLVGWGYSFSQQEPKPQAPTQQELKQEETKYDSEKQRNPFVPLVTSDGRLLTLQKAPEVKQLVLQGITFDPSGFSFCVINGEVAMVGSQIDEYRIIKIEKEKVTLIKDGETLEMELRKEEKE